MATRMSKKFGKTEYGFEKWQKYFIAALQGAAGASTDASAPAIVSFASAIATAAVNEEEKTAK